MVFGGWFHQASRSLDLLSRPINFFQELAEEQDLRPGIGALAVTSILFAVTSVVSHYQGIPYSAQPLLPLAQYRIYQAMALPAIFGAGWLLCGISALGLTKLLHCTINFRRLLAVIAPAIFVPICIMLWPTEMAVSLKVMNEDLPGFAGLWVRDLAPSLTLLYMLLVLWLAFWQASRLLLREAFAMAVLSLLPVLGFWAAVLR
jgi:hypothetical protein